MKWKLEKIINYHIKDLKEFQEISKNLYAYDMNILIHAIYLKVTEKNNYDGVNYFYVFIPEDHNYIKCWYHKSKDSIVFEIWKTKSEAELGIVKIGLLHYLL